MTFFQFISICFVTFYGTSLIYALIVKIETKSSNQSLISMLDKGELDCDAPLCDQIKEMSESVVLEELDCEFDYVDIERVREKLMRKNERLSEIVLEV